MNRKTSEQISLSPEALANLKARAESRKKESKWIHLDADESRVLSFNPEKVKELPSRFDSDKVRVQYKVIDPSIDMQERNYEVTHTQSGKIDELLAKGIANVRCTKDREGKFTQFEAA